MSVQGFSLNGSISNVFAGFLECRLALPRSFLDFQKFDSPDGRTRLTAREGRHAIAWVIIKPESLSADREAKLRTKAVLSTFEHADFLASPTESLTPLVIQLWNEWYLLCKQAKNHLKATVRNLSLSLLRLTVE